MGLKKRVTETEAKSETKEVATTTPSATPPVVKAENGSVFITNDGLVEAAMEAEYGTFVSVSASNGTHMNADVDMGKEIEFQVVLARDNWKCSTNSNDEESKDYFRASYYGEDSLADALQEALDAGYEKAAIKKYLDLYVLVTKCDAQPDMVGEVICMSLSPSSVRNWRPIAGRLKVKSAMGKLDFIEVVPDSPAVTFKSVATPTSYNGNNFSVMVFSIV